MSIYLLTLRQRFLLEIECLRRIKRQLNGLQAHAAELQAVLGSNFVGVYPVGSLAIGDFDLTSDVDFAVVTATDLNDAERV